MLEPGAALPEFMPSGQELVGAEGSGFFLFVAGHFALPFLLVLLRFLGS